MRFHVLILLAGVSLMATACQIQGASVRIPAPRLAKAERPGPPPHAPAHGYRHKHSQGVELAFDHGLGVYVVLGHSSLWYHHGSFLRLRGGAWEVSLTLDGPWQLQREARVPPGLARKHQAHPAKRGKPGKGRGPAKRAW